MFILLMMRLNLLNDNVEMIKLLLNNNLQYDRYTFDAIAKLLFETKNPIIRQLLEDYNSDSGILTKAANPSSVRS
jgi:hypothetical protein